MATVVYYFIPGFAPYFTRSVVEPPVCQAEDVSFRRDFSFPRDQVYVPTREVEAPGFNTEVFVMTFTPQSADQTAKQDSDF